MIFEHVAACSRIAVLLLLSCIALPLAYAQSSVDAQSSGTADSSQAQPSVDAPQTTFFPHPEGRFWISGQANFVSQWHPSFRSPYEGPNSLSPEAQDATSRVLTLLTGLRISPNSEVLFDLQETGGHGIGEALGLAGFTNLDVVRNPLLSKAPYLARLMWHQVIGLGSATVTVQPNPLFVFSTLPERRIEIRFGKFGLVDFFDVNSYGSDSNFQFLNWTIDNNGAYDYAADTRGYTYAAYLEYHDRRWSLRFAEALMPKVANGIHLDADLGRARAENVEFELRGSLVPGQQGAVRILSFVNHANMGAYRTAIDDFLAGRTPEPDITAHPLQTTIKYGFGANLEQPLNDWIGLFARWGWNEGAHESYAYAEVDQTLEAGTALRGKRWHRIADRAGAAFVSNGISGDHRRYLALGGTGFLLGDGRLNYGREQLLETYYTAHLWRGFFTSFDLQHVWNPGYNRDRGPVLVPALRLHMEF